MALFIEIFIENISCITVTPDSKLIIVLFEDAVLKAFDFDKSEVEAEPKLYHDFGNILQGK